MPPARTRTSPSARASTRASGRSCRGSRCASPLAAIVKRMPDLRFAEAEPHAALWTSSLASRAPPGAADRARRPLRWPRLTSSIIGAGGAGLTRRRAARQGGRKRRRPRGGQAPRRPRDGGARRGLQAQPRRPPARGLGLRHHEGLRARRQGARARRRLERHAGLGPREEPLGLDPRPLRGRQVRAQEGHPGADRHALRGARRLGRPAAARVDAPAHERPGRDRPVGVHLGARVHDRRLVRPLGLGQPLRAARCTTPRSASRATRSGRGRAGTGCSTTCATPSSSTAERCGWARRSRPC